VLLGAVAAAGCKDAGTCLLELADAQVVSCCGALPDAEPCLPDDCNAFDCGPGRCELLAFACAEAEAVASWPAALETGC